MVLLLHVIEATLMWLSAGTWSHVESQVVSGKLEGRLSSWLGWAPLPLHVVSESLHEVQGSEPRSGLDLTKYHFDLQSSHGPISRVKADPTS